MKTLEEYLEMKNKYLNLRNKSLGYYAPRKTNSQESKSINYLEEKLKEVKETKSIDKLKELIKASFDYLKLFFTEKDLRLYVDELIFIMRQNYRNEELKMISGLIKLIKKTRHKTDREGTYIVNTYLDSYLKLAKDRVDYEIVIKLNEDDLNTLIEETKNMLSVEYIKLGPQTKDQDKVSRILFGGETYCDEIKKYYKIDKDNCFNLVDLSEINKENKFEKFKINEENKEFTKLYGSIKINDRCILKNSKITLFGGKITSIIIGGEEKQDNVSLSIDRKDNKYTLGVSRTGNENCELKARQLIFIILVLANIFDINHIKLDDKASIKIKNESGVVIDEIVISKENILNGKDYFYYEHIFKIGDKWHGFEYDEKESKKAQILANRYNKDELDKIDLKAEISDTSIYFENFDNFKNSL